jgi:hypothetical protein
MTHPHEADTTIQWSEIQHRRTRRISLGRGDDFLAFGGGDIRRGPTSNALVPLPPIYRPAKVAKEDAVRLPDDWHNRDSEVTIEVPVALSAPIAAQRAAIGDGYLYVRMAPQSSERLRGPVNVNWDDRRLAKLATCDAVWLRLAPRIDSIPVVVKTADDEPISRLQVPTTLVETRGRELLVNNEPFLVKGTLPRKLRDADAEYLKQLGANTLRVKVGDDFQKAVRFGFMAIASCHSGPGKLCERATSDKQFRADMEAYLQKVVPAAREAVTSPNTLIIQLGNEQVTGQDPWLGRYRKPHSFERLDLLLAEAHNRVRMLDTMVPQGYSNCAFGYVAPSFLDVYLHNTYLDKDRNWPPIEQFIKLQDGDQRPFLHTEFGANVYMPQAHLRAGNSPLLEKIHAWNYPNRWREYLEAGTSGGTNYCLYDYDNTKINRNSWDRGYTNFGIMTYEGLPKLACWELWHLWRDFALTYRRPDTFTLFNRRQYWARDCHITICGEEATLTKDLGDIQPRGTREFTASGYAEPFRWSVRYTTHGGLPMVATGAEPRSVEVEDFLDRLSPRPTYAFLRELVKAEMITPWGHRAPATLKEMERADGVVPILFCKQGGIVYLTAFTRNKPKTGLYAKDVEIELFFAGEVSAIDEWTGELTGEPVDVEYLPGGVRLKGIAVPYIPPQYTHRADVPIRLPCYRITTPTDEARL